jgi:hypothetical protein
MSRRREGAAPATLRLELAQLAQAFKIARKRDKLATVPVFPTEYPDHAWALA